MRYSLILITIQKTKLSKKTIQFIDAIFGQKKKINKINKNKTTKVNIFWYFFFLWVFGGFDRLSNTFRPI